MSAWENGGGLRGNKIGRNGVLEIAPKILRENFAYRALDRHCCRWRPPPLCVPASKPSARRRTSLWAAPARTKSFRRSRSCTSRRRALLQLASRYCLVTLTRVSWWACLCSGSRDGACRAERAPLRSRLSRAPFRRLLQLLTRPFARQHPDKGGDPALFRVIQEAWEVLRSLYDAGNVPGAGFAFYFVGAGARAEAVTPAGGSGAPTQSYEWFEAAAEEAVPGYKVEAARSGRSGAPRRAVASAPAPNRLSPRVRRQARGGRLRARLARDCARRGARRLAERGRSVAPSQCPNCCSLNSRTPVVCDAVTQRAPTPGGTTWRAGACRLPCGWCAQQFSLLFSHRLCAYVYSHRASRLPATPPQPVRVLSSCLDSSNTTTDAFPSPAGKFFPLLLQSRRPSSPCSRWSSAGTPPCRRRRSATCWRVGDRLISPSFSQKSLLSLVFGNPGPHHGARQLGAEDQEIQVRRGAVGQRRGGGGGRRRRIRRRIRRRRRVGGRVRRRRQPLLLPAAQQHRAGAGGGRRRRARRVHQCVVLRVVASRLALFV